MLFPIKWKCFCLGCLGVEESFPEQVSSAANRKYVSKLVPVRLGPIKTIIEKGIMMGLTVCTIEQYSIIADTFRDRLFLY
jgi:hypothetical protein